MAQITQQNQKLPDPKLSNHQLLPLFWHPHVPEVQNGLQRFFIHLPDPACPRETNNPVSAGYVEPASVGSF